MILALFLACAFTPAKAQDIETHHRLVTSEEGRAIVQATLLHRAQLSDKPDCSHFVHDVYADAGLDYDYAIANDIFEGIDAFRRVQKPQPGDVIVWRGHAGIVIDPQDHSFYSSVVSGFSIHSYASGYWTGRGPHRFYRYKINDLQSAYLLSGLVYQRSVAAHAEQPAAHKQVLVASRGTTNNAIPDADPNITTRGSRKKAVPGADTSVTNGETRKNLASEAGPKASESEAGVLSESVPGGNVSARAVSIPSNHQPAKEKEEVRLAVTEFAAANAQELSQAAALNGPIEIIDGFEIAKIERQGNSGWVDVNVKKIAYFADGRMRPANNVEQIRLNLRREAGRWVVVDTANRTYVLRHAAVQLITNRIAALAGTSAGARQLKPLKQALAMLHAQDHS